MATFRKRTAGWQVQIRIKGHRPVSKTFRTKAMAEDWARRKEDEMRRGTAIDTTLAERTSVAQVLERYSREITPRKASASKELSRIRGLTAQLGTLSLVGLTPEEIIEYVDERLETVCADTVRKELSTLSHAIVTARALWRIYLPENPVRTAREILGVTKTLSPGVERIRRLTAGEEARLLATASAELIPVIHFGLETALRRGELARADRKHLSWHGREARLYVPETKTGRSRTIPLTKVAAQLVQTLPSRIDGIIFGLRPDSMSQAFARACRKAGVEDLRFHDLRHEATSRLFEQGLGIQEVAAITGHSDWRQLKRYTHVLPEHIARRIA